MHPERNSAEPDTRAGRCLFCGNPASHRCRVPTIAGLVVLAGALAMVVGETLRWSAMSTIGAVAAGGAYTFGTLAVVSGLLASRGKRGDTDG